MTRSHKVILATIEASERAKLFALESGSTYSRNESRFISSVSDGVSNLLAASIPLSAGQYYHDRVAGKLYIRTSDSSDPKTRDIVLRYRYFFSTSGHNLPHDLNNGEVVHWESRLNSIGALSQQLDDENTGVVVEANNSVTLLNGDGFFDDVFDTLIWENQACEFWTWETHKPASTAQKLFSGIVSEKTFSSDNVTFKLNDFTFRLRDRLNLDFFDSSDGQLSDSDLNTPKRRIYGRVKQMKCVGVQKTLDGFTHTQSVVGVQDDEFITFGGSMLGILFPGDEIAVTLPDGTEEKFGVDSITSPTVYAVSSGLDVSFSASSFRILPGANTRLRNREWFIAGHKLYEPSHQITSVASGNRFALDSVEGLYPGDRIDVDGEVGTIRRISGLTVVTEQSLSPAPVIGDTLTRPPVIDVWSGVTRLEFGKDYTLSNTTEAILTIDALAEFNIAPERKLAGTTLVFTSGSRDITSTSTSLDLRTVLKPRDWIRSSTITNAMWYEVAQVDQFALKIVTTAAASETVQALYKSPEYIGDDFLILVDCYGLEVGGEWIKRPSDVVKHLLTNDAALSGINTTSFDKAAAVCDYIVSMPLPASPGEGLPSIRETIGLINSSVFGSLFTNSSFQLTYSILNSQKPVDLEIIQDDDIYSFSTDTKNQIANEVIASYRPFVDGSTGEDAFEVYEFESSFVNKMTGIKKTEEITLYLYEQDKAEMMAQRFAFFRSLASSRVKLKAPQALAGYSLGDKVYLKLDRLFKRYGGGDRLKVAVVAGVNRDGTGVDLELNDLGSIYNRVPSIAPNTQPNYAGSTREQVAMFGFIVDNQTETPNASSEVDLGNNLIG